MSEYIKRKDALLFVRKAWAKGLNPVEYIEAVPPADVKPVVRGKWEPHGEGFNWVYICSVCGYVDGYPMNDRMNFCPNCGADMRGGDAE